MGAGASRSVTELEFSPDQRAWLQIEPHETLRVLASGPRTLLLERSGLGFDVALPWDRDLVLTCDVRAFALADLLHLLHGAAKSGFLFFEDGDHAKSVYLHGGEVVFAASNQSVDRLGECLLRSGMITPEQFRESRRAYTPQQRFGRILVERGYLTPRDLWNGVKLQVEEIVRSLFAHSLGTVYFWEGEVRPDNVVRLSLPTRRLIAEGLRRRDELLRYLAWLEDPRVALQTRTGFAESVGETERGILEAATGGVSFAEVLRKAAVDPLTGARTVQVLKLIGALAVERSDDGGELPDESDVRMSDEAAVRKCVVRHVKLLAELAAPIVAVEGPVAIRERLQTVVAEAARRYPELLSGFVIGAGGSLDPEDLIERALRFPGERDREVRLALGELLSYLEFDLLNHPLIDDPEQFLEAVEMLRSGL